MSSLGQQRVRVSFNPSSNSVVDEIKTKSAELIDLCEEHKQNMDKGKWPEASRCWALAQTYYEDAAMWAVKAATI
jgi:hypothetical protein